MFRIYRKRLIFGILLTLCLVALYKSDSILLKWPEEKAEDYGARLRRHLREKRDVWAYWSFEEHEPVEYITQTPCWNQGTTLVPGKFGTGRAFDGSGSCFIESSIRWRTLSSNYTLSCWVYLRPDTPSQAIICQQFGMLKSGLVLHDGQVDFHVPSRKKYYATYDFDAFNRFVHLAGVVDAENHQALLYQDGVLMATTAVESVDQIHDVVKFGKLRGDHVYWPLDGVIDEAVLWNRALSAEEVEALATTKRSLHEQTPAKYRIKLRLTQQWRSFLQATLKTVSFFNPLVHYSRIKQMGLPWYGLYLSRDDERFLNRTKNEYALHGFDGNVMSGGRKITVQTEQGLVEGTLRLYVGGESHRQDVRKSFVLKTDGKASSPLPSRLLFMPPESAGFLRILLKHRLAERVGIPQPESGLAVLTVNGAFRGVYIYEEYGAVGGQGRQAGLTLEETVEGLPVTREEVLEAYDELASEYSRALTYDMSSPLSPREMEYRIRADRKALAQVDMASISGEVSVESRLEALTESMVLAENPSAQYVIDDLDLDALNLPKERIQWQSSAPAVIDAEGHVTRPQGHRPVRVILTASLSDGESDEAKHLYLRVMPQEVRVPAIMVQADQAIRNEDRVDCLIRYHPAGSDLVKGPYAGGIKWRGNTALLHKKKSFSLKFEDPAPLLGANGSRFVYLTASFDDRSLLRNKICYDLFAELSKPGAPRYAPHVEFVELFINGEYQGLYQMGNKVDRFLIGMPAYDESDERPNVLYKAKGTKANFEKVVLDAYAQEEPPPEEAGPYMQPYVDLIEFLGGSSDQEFGREVDEWIDVACVRDFQLFVNVAHNRDGYQHNLYLARRNKSGDRFFIVPWDYDKTLGGATDVWLTNELFDRLMEDLPGYRDSLQKRWEELRTGPYSMESLNARIDELAESLDGYIDQEFEYWPTSDKSHEELVDYIRDWLERRMKFLDEKISRL